jgi:hypothetical protein
MVMNVKADEINRMLILNFIEILLQEYTVEEARFIRKPTNLFVCFMSSDLQRM